MHFSTSFTILLSLSSAIAAPIRFTDKRATAGVLTVQTYDDFNVSGGVAGNALAEVNAKFPIDQSNLVGVAASDLATITKAAQVSEDAEINSGGFDDAIAAASGAAATALQNDKIKNKVLKLQTDVLRIQIEVAQGNTASESSLSAQQKRSATNVALDKKAAGQASTAISFSASD